MKLRAWIIIFSFLSILGFAVWFFILHSAVASEEATSNYDKAQLYLIQGNFYFDKRLYSKAIEEYKKALQLKPSLSIYSRIGIAYYRIGAYKDAETSFKKSIGINPTAVTPYSYLGSIYSKEGRHDEAINMYEKALQRKADSVTLLNNLANAYMNKGLYDKAIAAVEKALAIKPSLASANITYGQIYEKKGDYLKALEKFEKVKNDPRFGRYAQKMISKITEMMKNPKNNIKD